MSRPVLLPFPLAIWRAALLSGLLCAAIAVLAIRYFGFHGNLASVWPANAVILAQVLGRRRREALPFLFAGFVAMAAGGAFERGLLLAPTLVSAANTVEIALAAMLLRGGVDDDGRLLHRHASVGRFALCAGLVAPATGASLAAVAATLTLGVTIESALATKFIADALGLLIFTPVLFGLFHGEYRAAWKGARKRDVAHMGLLYGVALLVAMVVFAQGRLPLLFLPMVPLMLLAFRLGWAGTSLGVLIVAVIGVVATYHGGGPISLSGGDVAFRLGFVQFYLGTILLLMLPVAAALEARRALIARLRDSERSLTLLADRSSIVLLRFATDGTCTRVVGDAARLLGCGADVLLGAHPDAIDPPLGAALSGAHLAVMGAEVLASGPYCRADPAPLTHEIQRGDGIWIEATFRTEHDDDGAVTGSVATLVDITASKRRERELSRRAETDALTGLVNRAGFLRRFEAALDTADPAGLSLALIDVDRFKGLNDGLGHLAGDAVLVEIARRIAGAVRSSDVVGRLGGDEFVVLLATGDARIADDVCRRIVDGVAAAPIDLPMGGTAEAQVSCGLVGVEPGQNGTELLNHADMALYAAKRAGRNRLIAAYAGGVRVGEAT